MLLIKLAFILLLAKIGGLVSRHFRQPAVLGQILAGLLAGPSLLGRFFSGGGDWASTTDILALAEIGVLLLMLIAGLETRVADLARVGGPAFSAAAGGILLPVAMGWAFGRAFGFSGGTALFIGLMLAATSISISAQILLESGRLGSPVGNVIMGAAVLDDILGVILIALVISAGHGAGLGGARLLGRMFVYLLAVAIYGWVILPRLVRMVGRLQRKQWGVTFALVHCLLLAHTAELAGLAGIIGAYLAGLMIGRTGLRFFITDKVGTLAYSLFVPVFLVGIGLQVRLGVPGQSPLMALTMIALLLVAAVAGKLLGSGGGARLAGMTRLQAIQVGAGMTPRGEVALIIADIGLRRQLLDQGLYAAVVIVVVITTLIAPPLLRRLLRDGTGETGG